ncbi:Fc.00g093960.m01.CDS01 [Cosmosporella sp. VM-42]
MPTVNAIIVLEEGKEAGVSKAPMPTVREEWILVKTKAVALNPTDWKHVKRGFANAGSRLGCDYAGVVEEVGSKVTDFKKGDRITGFCHGGHRLDHETGAFGEYILAKACAQIKIPEHLSFEQAATIPVSTFTCGLGLYKSLQLPLPGSPPKEPFPILIHGGSTRTGLWAIQFAKASGLTVIATTSPRNFAYLKSLGADAVFDYHTPTCGAEIRSLTQNKLRYAWDCAGGGESICAEALSDVEPSKYGYIAVADAEVLRQTNPLVDGPYFVLAYDILNEPYYFPRTGHVRSSVEEMEFARMFKEVTRELLEKGSIRCIDFTLNKGGSGLEGVIKGMKEMQDGKVSGTKLVYTL